MSKSLESAIKKIMEKCFFSVFFFFFFFSIYVSIWLSGVLVAIQGILVFTDPREIFSGST